MNFRFQFNFWFKKPHVLVSSFSKLVKDSTEARDKRYLTIARTGFKFPICQEGLPIFWSSVYANIKIKKLNPEELHHFPHCSPSKLSEGITRDHAVSCSVLSVLLYTSPQCLFAFYFSLNVSSDVC